MDLRSMLIDRFGSKVGFKDYKDCLDLETRAVDDISIEKPLAIFYPNNVDDIISIVRFANENRINLIPYGGGTGLMGGASAVKPSIIIDMKNINDVEVNEEDLNARVGAGVKIKELDDLARKHGLFFAHDPWSAKYATVAGAIATDGVGFLAAGYGSMRDQVLGLDVILPDAKLLRITPARKSYANPIELFIGTEGIFGIIAHATVKLYPLPEVESAHIFEFDGFDEAYNALRRLVRYVKPVSIDLSHVYALNNGIIKEWMHEDEGVKLYLVFHGSKEEVDLYYKKSKDILNAREVDRSVAEQYWKDRHKLADYYLEFINRDDRSNVKFEFLHVSIPISKVLEFSKFCDTIANRYNVSIIEKSIWHHLEFFSISLLAYGDDANKRMLYAIDEILSLASKIGAFEYCHGVGVKLARYVSKDNAEVLRKIKLALDPNGIMNSNKLINI